MTALEALQSVQYVSAKGKRFAVLRTEDWETVINWLENLEDLQTVHNAFAELKKFGGDREKAGWLRWDDVRDDL